ncbi:MULTISPECIES: transmembrane anchor protein [Sphingomonas]|uniref:Transmembrane anchor protein n=1 Tax=Sphingomonas molluscorum TaxID=418184 RepID=A0ABU8Q9Y1_9SPHN|nr:transmembrane anchor protein [Sphingomonas sp. JUb134]MBM7407917.1 hypothetical protein [Sphingomonas sp. JUb134]
MFNSQMPDLSDLPTSRQLVRSTLVAFAAAAAILVTVVLPSEYGVDPTGVGRVLDLTEMGEIKVQLAREAATDAAADASAPVAPPTSSAATPVAAATAAPVLAKAAEPAMAERRDEMSVTLAPGVGAEIKVVAVKGARIGFEWSVSGGHVNYDTHADAPDISYHRYGKGQRSTGERGTLIAAFDGSHGWFWRNRSGAPVTVVLRTNGGYSAIRRVV